MKKSLLCCFVTCVLLSACSFRSLSYKNELEVKDISNIISFSELSEQGYMGGSLIYNPNNRSIGQLDNNVSVAIRLCKAGYKSTDEEKKVFYQISDSIEYGLLYINSINESLIDFTVILYNISGEKSKIKNYILSVNESADINDDGLYDIKYAPPSSKRRNYEKAVYLQFLSSQENLNISMYSVLKEQYKNGDYPNGIIGVNNNNRFIISKYSDSDSSVRSIVQGVYPGDYIIDNQTGLYQYVKNNNYCKNSRSISDEDLDYLNSDFDDNYFFTIDEFSGTELTDFLNSFPEQLIDSVIGENEITKVNELLKRKDLIILVAEQQNIPDFEEYRLELQEQLKNISDEDIVYVNRSFLEENYPSCPHKTNVSQTIIEVLPLASVVLPMTDFCIDNDLRNNDSKGTDRAATSSFYQAKSKSEYLLQLNKMESIFDQYELKLDTTNITIPITTQYADNKSAVLSASLKLKESRVGIAITGSFDTTWGSVNCGLSTAAFLKLSSGVSVIISRSDKEIDKLSDNVTIKSNNSIDKKTVPLFKTKIKLLEYDKGFNIPGATFLLGPIPFSFHPYFSLGIPMSLDIEMDGNISYDIYIAGLAQAGFSVGMDYGVEWKKKKLLKLPYPYTRFHDNSFASADSIFYIDTNGDSFDIGIKNLNVGFTVNPHLKIGIEASAAAIVHGGFDLYTGLEGYSKFGYQAPRIKGVFGLNLVSKFQANVFLGLKNVKLLCIPLGDIGKNWIWDDLLNETIPIIPETVFLDRELKK